MNSTEYIEKMVQKNAFIYMDTASLMNNAKLRLFIDRSEKVFLGETKRIIITRAVRAELYRHLFSPDDNKSRAALEVIEIVSKHEEMFEVEGGMFTDEEALKAFADADLLAALTLHKSVGNQLLITNDRNLSADAFGLNWQASIKGHRINVCYINWSGELRICECVKDFLTKDAPEPESVDTPVREDTPSAPFLDEALGTQAVHNTEPAPVDGKCHTGAWMLAIGGSFAGGLVVGKYGKAILKGASTLKSII
jgi:rRNA-processing protein FCF1